MGAQSSVLAPLPAGLEHALCRAVVGCALRGILGYLRRRAVTVVQRFGGALNMNIHFHALVMDGVFARDGDAVRFHPNPSLDAADIDEILATIGARTAT